MKSVRRFNNLIYILLISSSVCRAESSYCTHAGESASAYVKSISQNRYGDVSGDIKKLKELVGSCRLDPRKLGIQNNLSYQVWENLGYERELLKLRERIIDASNFREVEIEVAEYRMWSEKLKRDPRLVENYLSGNLAEYRRKGRAAQESEQKKCQPSVDLRGPQLGPVRDQDSIGWCYAFAASELLTFKLGKKISAADMAMNHNDHWFNTLLKKTGKGEHDFEGGWTKTAIDATSSKGGACLESNFRSEDNAAFDLKKTLEEIDKFKKSVGQGLDQSQFQDCYKKAKFMFSSLNISDFKSIFEKTIRAEFIKALSDKACGPRIKISQFHVRSEDGTTDKGKTKIFDLVDEQLNKRNISNISYNGNLLYDTDSKGNDGHAGTVVGRRFNIKNNECEYLIRNSWGRGCQMYAKNLDCEEGNIWIPKSVLSRSPTLNATYIE